MHAFSLSPPPFFLSLGDLPPLNELIEAGAVRAQTWQQQQQQQQHLQATSRLTPHSTLYAYRETTKP